MKQPRVAIYDFTDCEGCEIVIVSLREKFLDLEKRVDIIDWRLVQERKSFDFAQDKPLDICIIEGTPITQGEINTLKHLRKKSKYLLGLGACACLAGIPGILKKEERKKWYKKIYGQAYKPKGIDALPLQNYVKVDFLIHGCPVNPEEVIRIIGELLLGRKPNYRPYSVCFECKLARNKCRLVSGEPCLGPIAQGGCDAICVSGGSPCYGCFGIREDANIEGLKKILGKKEFERYMSMFLNKYGKFHH